MGASVTAQVQHAVHAALQRSDVADARLIVAYSGGQDSTCLLHTLREHAVMAVHVDHGLRPNSAEDAQRVLALAREMGVDAEVVRVDVAAYRRSSVQQAARAARYQALGAAADKHRATAVLTAHTRDDQAETLLLHLLRGSGLRGLAGMPLDETLNLRELGPTVIEIEAPAAAVRVVRPLLGVSRPMTLAYCAEQGLPIVEDASNQSRAYTRNRVRLDLLPALEHFNPNVREVLARTADLLAEDAAALDVLVESLHAELAQPIPDGLRYDFGRWQAQPLGVQRRLLRRGLAALLGTLTDVRARPIDDALALLRSGSARQTYHLPYGVELCLGRDAFELRLHGRAQPRKNWDREVPRV